MFRRICVVALMAASLAACGTSESSLNGRSNSIENPSMPTKISVGVIPIVDVAPLYLGVQKGIFRKQGLTVTPHVAQSGASIVDAVLEERDQFGFSNMVSLLMAREALTPIQVIGVGSSSTGNPARDVNAVLVGKGSTLSGPKDLAGKRVAINAHDNIGDTTIRAAVEKAGGDPAAVKFVEVPFTAMPAQLAAGMVDAVWETEPYRTQVLDQGGRILFNNLTEVYPKLQIAGYFTGDQTIATTPQLVEKFAAGLNESLNYAATHQAEVRAILSTYMKITPDVADKIVLPAWPTKLDTRSATAVGLAAQKYGTLHRPPDAPGLFGFDPALDDNDS